MKQSIMSLISLVIITVFFIACTHNPNVIEANDELNSKVETIIMQSNFWKLFYIGRYSYPTETCVTFENGRTYKSFDIRYSEISDDYLDICNVNFDNLREYQKGYYFASMPFTSLAELKKHIETIYTPNCAERILYNIYDNDYVECNSTILRAFDSDTVLPYILDYGSISIISSSDKNIIATINGVNHDNGEIIKIEYHFISDSGTWKIDDIIEDWTNVK